MKAIEFINERLAPHEPHIINMLLDGTKPLAWLCSDTPEFDKLLPLIEKGQLIAEKYSVWSNYPDMLDDDDEYYLITQKDQAWRIPAFKKLHAELHRLRNTTDRRTTALLHLKMGRLFGYSDSDIRYFLRKNMFFEGGGYIPQNEKEARDPRWERAISCDVHPGQDKVEAKKFGFKIGKKGPPIMNSNGKLTEEKDLEYLGNCTEDDIVEELFGDATNFAQALEDAEYLDEDSCICHDYGIFVKYNPDNDIHYFYRYIPEITEAWEVKPIAKKVGLVRESSQSSQFKVLYHGVNNINAIDDILKCGFKSRTGRGFFATTTITGAKEYGALSQNRQHEYAVLKLQIPLEEYKREFHKDSTDSPTSVYKDSNSVVKTQIYSVLIFKDTTGPNKFGGYSSVRVNKHPLVKEIKNLTESDHSSWLEKRKGKNHPIWTTGRAYHGTALEKLSSIIKNGITPYPYMEGPMTSLSAFKNVAKDYSTMHSKTGNSVVLPVRVPEPWNLGSGEMYLQGKEDPSDVGYAKIIPPENIDWKHVEVFTPNALSPKEQQGLEELKRKQNEH